VVEKKICVSIDEKTDAEDHYVASVIIGTLLIERPGEIIFVYFGLGAYIVTKRCIIIFKWRRAYTGYPNIFAGFILRLINSFIKYIVEHHKMRNFVFWWVECKGTSTLMNEQEMRLLREVKLYKLLSDSKFSILIIIYPYINS